jgi:hypothetical protein
MENGPWRRVSARYKALDRLAQTVSQLEKGKDPTDREDNR